MVEVEVANRSGVAVNEHEAVELVLRVLGEEESTTVSSASRSSVARKACTQAGAPRDRPDPDVLSFPIDGREELPAGVPRQLGDIIVCPEVVGEDWRDPIVHGLLHLLGYDR